MPVTDPKDDLLRYLRAAREAVRWKLEGLSEYDVRRPMTPTGTNLLGLVKHLASVEAEYFGFVFGRPWPEPMPWTNEQAEANADMWATAEESRAWVLDLYSRAVAHADETIEALPLDALGRVPWWPEDRAETTLHRILVHMIAETDRHAGQMDILRETIDGAVGMRAGPDDLPDVDTAYWAGYVERLEQVARSV